MSEPPRFPVRFSLLALAAVLLASVPVRAGAVPVRVVSSDSRGVTLQLTVGAWSLSAADVSGRTRITGLPGAHVMSVPGRPQLPAWSTTLAVPPDASPSVRVLSSEGEQSRALTRLVIAGEPVFRGDPASTLGEQPAIDAVDAIVDGAWPPSSAVLTAPFGFRGRRLVALELRPFRYDEAGARVWAPLTLTVRVDFNQPAGAAALPTGRGAADRHVDGVLETTVLNWEQARGWRVAPAGNLEGGRSRLFGAAPAAGQQALAFDETEPEVRVRLDESALYWLAYDELSPKGYPANVPVAEVSVHRHEYLASSVPPYGTIELPCEVQDANANGVFDSGDGVWLWSRTWAERSNATQIRRTWGDAEVVFVTRKAGALRVAQRPGWNDVAGLTPLDSYPSKRHYEKDFAPIMPFVAAVVDTNIGLRQWTDIATYYNRPDTIRVETNDLDDSKPATAQVRWVGRRADFHLMWAAFRNGAGQVTTFADSIVWFGKQAMVGSGTIPGTALTEGNTNFFRHWGKNSFAPPDPTNNFLSFVGLDWFELTYWRRFNAVKDYIGFNSADATGDLQMQVGGFSSDSIRVYDVTDPSLPVRITVDPAHVSTGPLGVSIELQDVAAAGTRRQYVAACIQNPADPAFGPHVPPSSAFSAVTRTNLWANTAGDYLLLVPTAFTAAVAPLEALRASQGLAVVHAPIESVYDEFGDGRHNGYAIERFARYAYEQWDARFLMLVGDGTLDPTGVRRYSGTDWIPVLPTPGPVGSSEGWEIIPSDNRYGNVTGKTDPIYELAAGVVVPELMVGRLTVNSLVEAATVVNKIVAYETVTQPDDWRRNILLCADDAFSGETTFGGPATSGYCHRSYEELFVTINNQMQTAIEADTGVAGLNVEQFNLRYFLPDERWALTGVNGDTCRLDRDETRGHGHSVATPALLGKLNAGQLLWNYQGHANEYVLTHEDLWINSGTGLADDTQRLGNNNKPFVFTAFSCHANMFARPDAQLNPNLGPCLGEDFLALPNGRGAVASWASVSYEVVPRPTGHVDIELIRSLFVIPPADEFLGSDQRGARVVLGEAVLATLLRYLPTTESYLPERGLTISYTLLGDPATRISIGRPLSTVLANGQPVPADSPVRLHTLGDTLRLDASIVSNVRMDSVALYRNTGSGDVPVTGFTLTPPFPDTGAAGVYGGRHFDLLYRTTLEARTYDYAIVARDRNGLVQRTAVLLQLDGVLRSSGTPIADGDDVAPNAALSLLVLCPKPILDPQGEITLTINGQPQAFSAAANPGDPSSREWILSWSHADYPVDSYEVVMSVQAGGSVTRRFDVTAASGTLAFRDLFPFPNPFDNDGTRFSFLLLGGEIADVKLHVFAQSGRSIYTHVVRGLTPGYHQLAWDGHDAEGDQLANGVYFFRLVASTPSGGSTQQLGRLVKLRRPRHVEEPVVP